MFSNYEIKSSVSDLTNDIRKTNDPIKRTMLMKFLDIKMCQERADLDDPSLDDLSNVSNESIPTVKSKTKNTELDEIMKLQKDSLGELDKISKIKAYVSMIDENKKDADKQDIENVRGKREQLWQSKDIYDPRYVKYQKEDAMNNKMMERLNSEIDFRTDDTGKIKIEKPFDDEFDDTEQFARYERSSEHSSNRVKLSKKQIGKKRQIFNQRQV